MMKVNVALVLSAVLASSATAQDCCPSVQLYHLEENIRADPDDTSKDANVVAAKKKRIDASLDYLWSSLPDTVVGLGTFSDMGLEHLGEKDKSHCYKEVTTGMVTSLDDIKTATSALALENGGDEKNSQLTAVQVVALSTSLFKDGLKDSRGADMPRIITLQTRSGYHTTGDAQLGAIQSDVEENPGDGTYDCDQLGGDKTVIDYPSEDQIATALKSTNTALAVVCTPDVFSEWDTLAKTLKGKDAKVEVRQCAADESDAPAQMMEALEALNGGCTPCGGGSTETPESTTDTVDSAAFTLSQTKAFWMGMVASSIFTYFGVL